MRFLFFKCNYELMDLNTFDMFQSNAVYAFIQTGF